MTLKKSLTNCWRNWLGKVGENTSKIHSFNYIRNIKILKIYVIMIVHFPFDVSKQRVPFDAARASVSKNDIINAIKIKFIVFERIQMIIKINRALSSGILMKLWRYASIFIALSARAPNRLKQSKIPQSRHHLNVYVSGAFTILRPVANRRRI